jgi:hypothetical protein
MSGIIEKTKKKVMEKTKKWEGRKEKEESGVTCIGFFGGV